MTDENSPVQPDRRVHHKVRKVFSEACVLIAPMLVSDGNPLNMSSFAIAHMLQNHFPELTNTEVHILITAAERLHRKEPH